MFVVTGLRITSSAGTGTADRRQTPAGSRATPTGKIGVRRPLARAAQQVLIGVFPARAGLPAHAHHTTFPWSVSGMKSPVELRSAPFNTDQSSEPSRV